MIKTQEQKSGKVENGLYWEPYDTVDLLLFKGQNDYNDCGRTHREVDRTDAPGGGDEISR